MPAIPEEKIRGLISKYLKDGLTETERQELNDLAARYPGVWELISRMEDEDYLLKDLQERHAINTDRARAKLWAKLDAEDNPKTSWTSKSQVKWIAAASVILILGTGIIYRETRKGTDKAISLNNPVSRTDVEAGSDRAILKLADGRQIHLDSIPAGNIIDQTGPVVRKENKNSLVYPSAAHPLLEGGVETDSTRNSAVFYHTLTTPRAGQFRVTLPDGTKVSLNNASSLRYPTMFTGSNREVELTGEAYFEVAKDKSRPFRVLVNRVTVDVLGTSFTIRDYDNGKNIRTTLLTGGVRVTDGVNKKILRPGEELNIEGYKNWQVEQSLDTAGAVAWTKGYFLFNQEELSSVLQELARWYDVDVENLAGKTEPINARLSRSLSLSNVLNDLNIPHTIDGRKLTILKDSPSNH